MIIDKKTANYLTNQRWCNFKEDIRRHNIKRLEIDSIPFDNGNKLLSVGQVELADSGEKRYFMMPLAREEKSAENTLQIGTYEYSDALKKDDFWQKFNELFDASPDNTVHFLNGWKLKLNSIGSAEIMAQNSQSKSRALGVEQSNTTLAVGDDALAFKLERMLDFSKQLNPEFEMNEKLMNEQCPVMPKTYGYFTLQNNKGETASSGIVQEFVKNDGDLWNYSLAYLKEKLAEGYKTQKDLTAEDNPEFIAIMQNLGQKAQQMSECLSRADNNPAFTPLEADASFTHGYDKQLQVLLYRTKNSISENLERLPYTTKHKAENILHNWDTLTKSFINSRLKQIADSDDKGYICRVHGDFHLGQVMVTKDKDLRIIDFAGEPDLPLEQRKQKHIYVRDVAGMYRSIKGYLGAVATEEFAAAAPDTESQTSRRKYAQKAVAPLINAAAETFLGKHSLKEPWLSLEVLRKNLYEVNYEVNNRPQMAYVAINGLADLLQKQSGPNLQKENKTERTNG
jgi:maltose alpha-D-glucosyltransferase/alpha-amylase